MKAIVKWAGVGLAMITLLFVGRTDVDAQKSFTLNCVIRDFRDSHPDFESDDPSLSRIVPNIVKRRLGLDTRPVYNDQAGYNTTHGEANFNMWFRNTRFANTSLNYSIELTRTNNASVSFLANEFFPIDNEGFGNEDRDHNFHFTMECPKRFTYQGTGDEFIAMTADDDAFLFINGFLVIDMGGRHPALTRRVDLDKGMEKALGLVPGEVYPLHIFFAERHTSGSAFGLETSVRFETDSCILTTPQGETRASCIGTPGDDIIEGSNQDDIILGLGGSDILNGNLGDDVILGGAGEDDIQGGPGSDALFGENDDDRVSSYGRRPGDNVQRGDPEVPGFDQCNVLPEDDKAFNILKGGPDHDLICSGAAGDELHGDEGDDRLMGEGGSDTLLGGPGNDILNAGCGAGDFDRLDGRAEDMAKIDTCHISRDDDLYIDNFVENCDGFLILIACDQNQ